MKIILHVIHKLRNDILKMIEPNTFHQKLFIHKNIEIDVWQIKSSDNWVNLFLKALPTKTFSKLINNIGIQRYKDSRNFKLKNSRKHNHVYIKRATNKNVTTLFFFSLKFCSVGFY